MKKTTVLGAGSWGTTLALQLARNQHEVRLWEYRPEVAQVLAETRRNDPFLPGIPIPNSITISADLEALVADADLIAFVVPSSAVRSVAHQLNRCEMKSPIIVNAAKGIEIDSLLRMSEVLKEELPGRFHPRIATLSGPSHAEEVSRNIPTTIVAASENPEIAAEVQATFMSPTLRIYTNRDIVGVELAGSLKNVIAIATGICDGLGFGDNTKGALLTRGLAEISRLGVAMGANPLTFAGLSGMGDLITTCMSRHSRNRYVGEQIGKGRKLAEILDEMVMVAEGVKTTRSAHQLRQKMNIDMPITEKVYDVLFNNEDPKTAVASLMERDPKSEIE
ncbi:MAG: NAD(P)H-dependent glycerol-3-phosphate dehydrogenase [Gemmatimonadetes bacterium]|nr:MAG: NAD(P)H-dependent glycerol-3-phosphate dehydrogenase [Gemmatimonadota bacterium]